MSRWHRGQEQERQGVCVCVAEEVFLFLFDVGRQQNLIKKKKSKNSAFVVF